MSMSSSTTAGQPAEVPTAPSKPTPRDSPTAWQRPQTVSTAKVSNLACTALPAPILVPATLDPWTTRAKTPKPLQTGPSTTSNTTTATMKARAGTRSSPTTATKRCLTPSTPPADRCSTRCVTGPKTTPGNGQTVANSWRMSGDIYDNFDRPDARCPCTGNENYNCALPGFHCSAMNILNKVGATSTKASHTRGTTWTPSRSAMTA
jgi:hypothetical protein